ncbi:hypothetical protein [Chitinophaga sp. CF418]|uniref:hypothetical protein n=1 Tax=Chitinophaga sp. CF418 TaxID=1855287 RepID=UPI000913DB35|nr:hypothetical protein [Chitinophaga sp. CF418]SHN32078.1 hypothetical protein SAMN05216311_10924 [Chitinophaga sp. CF418]
MFKNVRFIIPLFIISVLLSSCFEIVEDVTVKKDGSGSMKLTLNFSQSKTKIGAIMLMDSINGYKVPNRNEIEDQIEQAAARLKTIRGISNVSHTADFTNFIASINFSFRNVADVNNLVKELLAETDIKTKIPLSYRYNREEALFSKDYTFSPDVKEQFNRLKERDKEVFRTASYISILRFENTISSYSNQGAKMSKNQLAIMQRLPVSDLVSGKANISNQIQLSR